MFILDPDFFSILDPGSGSEVKKVLDHGSGSATLLFRDISPVSTGVIQSTNRGGSNTFQFCKYR